MEKISNLLKSIESLTITFVANFGVYVTGFFILVSLIVVIWIFVLKSKNKKEDKVNMVNSVLNEGNNVSILNSNK